MQNTVTDYINCKVINIKSELLFREAEDDLFYFNDLKKAAVKLGKALEYTPGHIKSIILFADVCFMSGKFKKALSLYLRASNLKKNDFRILASVANCFNALKKYNESLKYCNSALRVEYNDGLSVFAQVLELKINNLLSLGYFEEAYSTFMKLGDYLKLNPISDVYSNLSKKLKMQKKLNYSGLKIV